ncbi:MAG TPA: CDP-alcohol phosphatidyltransferase family protein [Egibacteraceae bacterium]|nr:CDP-alcohol phosphatidyltransferase family protein [Egibacteraceae bacterium]
MLDRTVRRAVEPVTSRVGGRLAGAGVPADALTLAGLVLGLASAVAVATTRWWLGLGLWLASRVLDGLDGAVARAGSPSDSGAFLDIVSDFTVYGAFVVGVAAAVPDARLACAVLLFTYYVNGASLLAYSSLAERRGLAADDERGVRFLGGLTEGTETVVVHSLFCVLPAVAVPIAWAFAAAVGLTAVWRTVFAARVLRRS